MGAFTRSDPAEISQSMARVFASFPRLKERAAQLGGTLSGGEQQMLATGRGLMSRPTLLLLDEPSMGLSPIMVEEIFRIIKEINSQGTSILLVEQNALMALQVAHRAYVLETGRIVLQGSASELRQSSRVKEAYLGLPKEALAGDTNRPPTSP
jgi:branched-chain amino acid transport system ATP-binding protein